MQTDDALLFIDANRYIALYRTEKGKLGLDALAEQASRIFVTQQVVDEVLRNKVAATAALLADQLREHKLQPFKVADHRFGTSEERHASIRDKIGQVSEIIRQINEEEKALALDMLDKVSRSDDPVSMTLATIFAKAVQPSETELQLARRRKEVGNPPGKRKDVLGDQLSWQQLLTHLADKRRLWIITSDGDYATQYYDRHFVNAFLLDELQRAGVNAFLFPDLLSGIKDFAEQTGVPAEQLPSEEIIEEIKEEEANLPRPHWLASNADAIQETLNSSGVR